MTSLRKSINAGFVIVSILAFISFKANKTFASGIEKCSHTNNCNHNHVSTNSIAGYEYDAMLNFSKNIKDCQLKTIIDAIPVSGRQYRLRTIVLDAGHGGKDAG